MVNQRIIIARIMIAIMRIISISWKLDSIGYVHEDAGKTYDLLNQLEHKTRSFPNYYTIILCRNGLP